MGTCGSCKLIITIDGPAGSGKSTLARNLARALGITYLDTGATYRALALKALREGISLDNESEAAGLVSRVEIAFQPAVPGEMSGHVFLDDEDVTDQLFNNEVSIAASRISRHPSVRNELVNLQRRMAEEICSQGDSEDRNGLAGVVVEGRDTGTVIFPNATVKIFLVASLEERARRRAGDFRGKQVSLEEIMAQLKARDESDMGRPVGPLKPAPDAIIIDNTSMTQSQTLQAALEIILKRVSLKNRDRL